MIFYEAFLEFLNKQASNWIIGVIDKPVKRKLILIPNFKYGDKLMSYLFIAVENTNSKNAM
jgi:hypothetical protein